MVELETGARGQVGRAGAPGGLEERALSDPGVASVDTIRTLFPALARLHRGHPVAHFDAPGGTQVPQRVADAMADYLLHHNANTHWPFPTSAETDAALDDARAVVAAFLNGDASEVVFGANMTTLTFHLGRALARGWSAGDEVVVTELDHHANVDTWRALEAERGVVVRRLPMIPETGQLDLDALDRLLGPKTRLVAVGAASNALGTVNDLARVRDAARGVGALLFVDGVHSAPHLLPDVATLGCDFFTYSPYKVYGPHLGVLWGRRELIEALDAPRLEPASPAAPERLETGTLSHEGVVGAAAAIEFLADLDLARDPLRAALVRVYAALHARGQALLARLWAGLDALPNVTLYGPPPEAARTPTLSFHVTGRDAEDVGRRLAERGLFLSTGDFYAQTVIQRLGRTPDGVVRAGCCCTTTAAEVDRLVGALAELR